MDPESEIRLGAVGLDLLSHAQQFGEPNRLPLTTQLFPFLLVASRRMSTREISAWLQSNKGITLSAAGISKGLSRPELHVKRIAEFVQPLAAYIVAVYPGFGETPRSLLYEKDPQTGKSVLHEVFEKASHDPDGLSEGICEAFDTLRDLWDSMPEEVQLMCLPYFSFDAKPSDDESDDDSNQSSPQ
jgi:hypothetical protein